MVREDKEVWEPIISRLFEQDTSSGDPSLIAEIWALDDPCHGDSYEFNVDSLRMSGQVSIEVYGHAFHRLFRDGHVNPQHNDVVLIGSCAGSVASILTATLCPSLFSSLIIIEPLVVTEQMLKAATKWSTIGAKRRDTWPSREDALLWMKYRLPWNRWHPDVLDLLVTYGMKESTTGVQLKCPTSVYHTGQQNFQDPYNAFVALAGLCSVLPVHAIFGARPDYVSPELQAMLCDVQAGRKMASVSRIPDAGHMVWSDLRLS
ncbi:hypothetical protein EIP91_010484 [Steccherinum ochraceum]|uniref:Uncharacterized protein n=1 Tax=Steccherinum ochraceum TaxID=92696 RepID=A0A4R0RSS3_9APHY|nr:hypothetical protein EIP91_010484 [Steccherinum ochraceum]